MPATLRSASGDHSKVLTTRDMNGEGLPAAYAAQLNDNTTYPPGSKYTNLLTGKLYIKNNAGTWVDQTA
jgi:hypothetical protein